jgi:quinol monooxygenase YgiN
VTRVAQFAKLTGNPGCGAQVETALQAAKAAAANEPGTEVFAIHRDPAEVDVRWVYEVYLSRDAQAAHSGSAATAQLRETLSGLLSEPLSVLQGLLLEEFGLPADRSKSGHGDCADV